MTILGQCSEKELVKLNQCMKMCTYGLWSVYRKKLTKIATSVCYLCPKSLACTANKLNRTYATTFKANWLASAELLILRFQQIEQI